MQCSLYIYSWSVVNLKYPYFSNMCCKHLIKIDFLVSRPHEALPDDQRDPVGAAVRLPRPRLPVDGAQAAAGRHGKDTDLGSFEKWSSIFLLLQKINDYGLS